MKIFLDGVDASYSKSVRKGTVMSFLGALRGLASISHILLDTALAALAHTHPRASLSEYAFNRDVEGACATSLPGTWMTLKMQSARPLHPLRLARYVRVHVQ